MNEVGLLKINSYDKNLKEEINKLLSLIGGLESFIKRGDKVLLKPNFITARSPENAATTHPEFIASVAELLIDYGCKVSIGDSPGLGSAKDVAKKIGLYDRLKKYDVDIINFEKRFAVDVNNKISNPRFKNLYLAEELKSFDRIINLPKLKSHAQMGITLATKNLYGCVVGKEKGQWHFAAGKDLSTFARLIVEICLNVNADLHILDGIIGMDGNGPTNGNPRNFNVALASNNPIALDRVVVELIGKDINQFPIFLAAKDLDLPGIDLSQIDIKGNSIDECKIDNFQIPSLISINFIDNKLIKNITSKLINQRLLVDYSKCINCRKCENQCPAKAITYNGKIFIDHNKCIRCCCCQEICPVGALSIKDPVTLKFLRRFGFR